MKIRHWLRVASLAALSLVSATATPISAQQASPVTQSGSARSDRAASQGALSILQWSNPSRAVFYAATATGGLWKTVNNGITFEPVFDNQSVISIGAVAVSQSNPDVVYVGTGEGNNSRSSYYGDGIYKSTDAGATWKNVGLPNSGHFGRIVINPTNPNIVFAAALGNLYSENPDRGLYRTTDGGATWVKVLDHKVDGRAIGAVDVAMDPVQPAGSLRGHV